MMGIRKDAKAWMRKNHPNELYNKLRVSKYHPQDIWFFTLPISYFHMNNIGHVNFLLQYENEPNQFHYLKVPFEFFRKNKTKFAIRSSGDKFDLHISAKRRNWLIDERSRGVGFNEFQQNVGQSSRSSREENGRSHFEDKKHQEQDKRKKRTPSARATHAEWHEILQIAPDSSMKDIHRAGIRENG